MNKLLIFLSFITLLGCASSKTSKSEKKELKAQQKQQKQQEQELAREKSFKAIKDSLFVLETYAIYDNYGVLVNVTPTTNFIAMNGEDVVVQLSFPGGFAGPNGLGGITLTGKASNIKIAEKKNSISLTFDAIGPVMNARIQINLSGSEGNYADARLTPQTQSGAIRFRGNIVPMAESNVYEGPLKY